MSPRRNWDSPNPSLASECCAPPPRTGGHTRLRVRGWESPNSDDWRKNSASSVLRKNKVQILIFGHFNIFSLNKGNTIDRPGDSSPGIRRDSSSEDCVEVEDEQEDGLFDLQGWGDSRPHVDISTN